MFGQRTCESDVLNSFTNWKSVFFGWFDELLLKLGGGFKYFLFSPLFGEDSHVD